jgi:hypothetical protein
VLGHRGETGIDIFPNIYRKNLTFKPRLLKSCTLCLRVPVISQSVSLSRVHTLYCASKARKISAVDLVRRQARIVREVVAKQPRLRAIPREELAGCCAPDHGEVTLPDMTIALWNRPANKRDTRHQLNFSDYWWSLSEDSAIDGWQNVPYTHERQKREEEEQWNKERK